MSQTSSFAQKGYRTLAFAYKEYLEKEHYSLEEVESDLHLLGITGLEDILQEDAPKCIKDFRDAEIKFWMLTGDKH